MLRDRQLSLLAKERTSDYSEPAWSHKQAHNNGRLEELNYVLTLLNGQTNDSRN